MVSPRFNFRYTPLPQEAAAQHTIRILELFPERDTSAVIRCSVQQTSLFHKPTYEALSYCWGDASSKIPILCNGGVLEVTTNLHAALRHLRDPEKSRILWIDAICINQGPEAVDERSQQVQLMRHIYKNAQRVVIWLGEAHSDSHLALDLIRRIVAAKSKLDELGRVPYFRDEFLETVGLPQSRGLENKAWLCIRPFFQRPWFQRIWVVQEVTVAQVATVLCGPDEIAWDELISGIEIGVSSRLLISKRAMDPISVDFFESAHVARLEYLGSPASSPKYTAYNFEGLLNHLMWFRRRFATDPRDKAFALYGLANVQVEEMNLLADYSMDVHKAYKNITTAILRTSRNLDILSVPRGNTEIAHQLPSWVADWSDSLNLTMSLVGQTKHRYRASKHTKASPKFSEDSQALIIEGEIIDQISALAPTLDHADSLPPPNPDGWRKTFQQFSSTLDNISRNQDVLTEWQHLALDTPSPQYPTRQARETALEQTLCAAIPPELNMKANYEDWRSNEQPSDLVKKVNFKTHPWLFKGAVMLQLFQDAAKPDDKDKKQYRTMAYGRRLARTEKGYIALVPAQSRVGDQIVLSKGGKTPLVLRARAGAWELVGDSYVHGIMDGEAFKEDRCRVIHIV